MPTAYSNSTSTPTFSLGPNAPQPDAILSSTFHFRHYSRPVAPVGISRPL